LACLQRRLMRLRVHRTNCRIEIKKGSEEPEIIEGNRIIDCKEYSESIVLTYRDSITSEFFQKQSINKDSICIKNEYTDWDCFEFWRELKAPLTEELFSKYLRKKYKIHCVGFLNKDAKKYQYNIALQTSGLLKNEQMIPPIAIAGGLLDIFSESIAEEEIYEIFGRRVLDLISEYNKARNYDKILGSELYEELVVLRCARYTAELIQYFEDKVKDNEIEQNLMLKNEEYKEVFQKIERSEIYKRWESQWTLLNERQSC
ncbi:hypothetical protein, partial [Aminipila sp.]|uniref:hypothetical protein n=1 Tax=Aminipila sp. TaxID=2060095 RepID=UPI0028A08F60